MSRPARNSAMVSPEYSSRLIAQSSSSVGLTNRPRSMAEMAAKRLPGKARAGSPTRSRAPLCQASSKRQPKISAALCSSVCSRLGIATSGATRSRASSSRFWCKSETARQKQTCGSSAGSSRSASTSKRLASSMRGGDVRRSSAARSRQSPG